MTDFFAKAVLAVAVFLFEQAGKKSAAARNAPSRSTRQWKKPPRLPLATWPTCGAVVFDFLLDRSLQGPRQFLGDFHGILQTDGYVAYGKVGGKNMVHAGRRYFFSGAATQ
jgi:hypothetical protein